MSLLDRKVISLLGALCVVTAIANSIDQINTNTSTEIPLNSLLNNTSNLPLDEPLPVTNTSSRTNGSLNSTTERKARFHGIDIALGLTPPYPYPGVLTNPLCYPPYGVGYPLLNCGAPYWG